MWAKLGTATVSVVKIPDRGPYNKRRKKYTFFFVIWEFSSALRVFSYENTVIYLHHMHTDIHYLHKLQHIKYPRICIKHIQRIKKNVVYFPLTAYRHLMLLFCMLSFKTIFVYDVLYILYTLYPIHLEFVAKINNEDIIPKQLRMIIYK